VRELQCRMSSREFAEWAAFYRLEPFGEARGDLRAGIVAATMANTVRDPKQRSRPFTPQEFMPLVESEDTETTEKDPEELWARLKGWAIGAGANEHPE